VIAPSAIHFDPKITAIVDSVSLNLIFFCPQGNRARNDNPPDSKYCKECAAPIPSSEEISVTQTLETPVLGGKKDKKLSERGFS
jgi:hypothetical protein